MNKENKEMKNTIDQESFEDLAQYLVKMNEAFQRSAASAVNKHVTCRNWLNGFYIVHYEQNGSDRAKYGDKLLKRLVERLDNKSFSLTNLKNFRSFYLFFPQLGVPIGNYLANQFGKSQTASDFLQDTYSN